MRRDLESPGDRRTMGQVIPFARKSSPMSIASPLASESGLIAGSEDGKQWGAWMAHAQQGDRIAYQALLQAVAPYLRSIARRMLGQDQDAEDVVQEILIIVHDIRHTYEPGRPFKPWLSTIATRRCIDVLRRRTRRMQHEIAGDDGEASGATIETPEERVSRLQSDLALREAVDSLPGRQREAIRLLRLQELTLNEAAARSEQSIGSLKVACHRAIKGLRRALRGKEDSDG